VKRNQAGWLVTAAVASLVLGCSFSDSSKSISDSISGSSRSFSDSSASSSGGDASKTSEKEALYREDVRNLTAAYVRDGGDVASFQRGLGSVARRHGISDWEAVDATWTGIGEGLKRADATPQQIDATSAALAGGNAIRRQEIQRGYAGQA
jgi:hypothetical protein